MKEQIEKQIRTISEIKKMIYFFGITFKESHFIKGKISIS